MQQGVCSVGAGATAAGVVAGVLLADAGGGVAQLPAALLPLPVPRPLPLQPERPSLPLPPPSPLSPHPDVPVARRPLVEVAAEVGAAAEGGADRVLHVLILPAAAAGWPPAPRAEHGLQTPTMPTI